MTDKNLPSSPASVPPVPPPSPSLDRCFLIFLGPLVLTNILQALTGAVNHIHVGRLLGAGSLADLGLLSLVNAHGSASTAAWGAASQVTSHVLFPAMAVAMAASVFAAQAIGAGSRSPPSHARACA
jgi:Na+-driven multidrug efflux pump